MIRFTAELYLKQLDKISGAAFDPNGSLGFNLHSGQNASQVNQSDAAEAVPDPYGIQHIDGSLAMVNLGE